MGALARNPLACTLSAFKLLLVLVGDILQLDGDGGGGGGGGGDAGAQVRKRVIILCPLLNWF